MPSGKPGMYSYLKSKDSVNIAAVNDQGRLFLVRAFRYPSKSWGWELPGGGGDGEEPITAALRELEEETGILADRAEILGTTVVCNGLMSEKMTSCVARVVSFGGHKHVGEEAISDGRFYDLKTVHQLVAEGEINDCQTLTTLYLYERWLQDRASKHAVTARD